MHDSNPYPTLDELDRDGAIREAASRVDGVTRAAFMRRTAALLGGGLAAGAVLPGVASAQTSGDVAILNYALTLEYLEAAFYAEAQKKVKLAGSVKSLAKTLGDEEAQHVQALTQAIKGAGGKPVKAPKVAFPLTSEKAFLKLAQVFEDTGVSAYNGAAPMIKSAKVLGAAGSIVQVEARHAAAIRLAAGLPPSPDAFDPSLTSQKVLMAVKPFIKS